MENTQLKALLDSRGISARQLAADAGVKYGTFYDVVSGKRTIEGMSVQNAAAIAHALDMSVEDLLGNEPPTLTANEADLLAIFRSLPPYAQRMLLAMARNVAEGVADE